MFMTTNDKTKVASLPAPPKKKRKKRTKRLYFTQVHEDAILEYVKTDSIKVRTELYVKYLGPAFSEMVDKIVFTYKFNTLPNIDYLKDDCKIWLTTILDKFDPEKGSKAFSYFSVITKNWFIYKVKKNSKQLKTTNVMVDKFYQLYSNAIATEALNKLILLKKQSFRLTHLEE